MNTQTHEARSDAALREQLRASMSALASASDRKHAAYLAAWYGVFTPKQRGFACVLLERARRAERTGQGPASVGEGFWEEVMRGTSRPLSSYVQLLASQGKLVEAIKAHRADVPGLGLREAKEAVEAFISHGRVKSAPSAVSREATISGADLESALAKAIEAPLASIQGTLSGQLRTQQESFQKSAASVIAQQVLAAALRELEARKPREVRISVTREGVTRAVSGTPHPKFEHLLRAASLRLASGFAPGILLAGEASSGKTHGAKMLADVLGLPWHFNGAISFPHEMLGFIDAGGTYHRTPFREAYEHGGVYTFDEVDRSDPVALLAVNPHLAGALATFPDGQIARHPDCIIVATANTWGHGADGNYSGATKLDGAFLSRFPVRISWDIDLQLEETLVGPGDWLKRLRADRAKAQQAGLKVLIDTRGGLAGAALCAAGYSVQEAAEMTYLAALKPDQRKLLGSSQ